MVERNREEGQRRPDKAREDPVMAATGEEGERVHKERVLERSSSLLPETEVSVGSVKCELFHSNTHTHTHKHNLYTCTLTMYLTLTPSHPHTLPPSVLRYMGAGEHGHSGRSKVQVAEGQNGRDFSEHAAA